MVGLTSSPQFDTGGIEVRLISGESLLEARCREEVRRRKEGVFQEDNGVKGIHFLNGLFPETGKPPAICKIDKTVLGPNIEYILSPMINNGIITHSSQCTI